MRKCKECKTEYSDEIQFCEKCNGPLAQISVCSACDAKFYGSNDLCRSCMIELNVESLDNSDDEANYSEYVSDDLSELGSFVLMSENEVYIKTYHCTTLRKPRGEGYLTITNKRVVFHGYGFSGGGKSKLVSEVPIEHVSGISSYYGYGTRFTVLGVLTGVLFIAFISLMFSTRSSGSISNMFKYLSISFLIATILFFMFNKKTNYNLSIFSSGANGSPINIGDGLYGSKITGQGAAFSIIADPTSETERMMDEIGAIILDLKNLGDHAIKKWSNKLKDKKNFKSKNAQQVTNTKVGDEEYFR